MKQLHELTDEELEELGKKFAEWARKKHEDAVAFWTSDICAKLIQDIVAKGKPLSADTFSYFERQVRETYGWEEVAHSDILALFDVLGDSAIGVEKSVVDVECPFENVSYLKRGLWCHLMYGQGTALTICPDKENGE